MDPLRTLESLAKSARTIKQSLPYWVDTAFSYVGLVKQAWDDTFTEAAREALVEKEAEEECGEPKQYPWGDSIPWPPEADLDDDRFRSAADQERAEKLGPYTIGAAFEMHADLWDHRPPICGQHWPKDCGCNPPHYHAPDRRKCWCGEPYPEQEEWPAPQCPQFDGDCICDRTSGGCWDAHRENPRCEHVHPPRFDSEGTFTCIRDEGHEGEHGEAGVFWPNPTVPPSTSPAAYTPTVDGEGPTGDCDAPAPSPVGHPTRVDRLGAAERGAAWHDQDGDLWEYEGQHWFWTCRGDGITRQARPADLGVDGYPIRHFGPFTRAVAAELSPAGAGDSPEVSATPAPSGEYAPQSAGSPFQASVTGSGAPCACGHPLHYGNICLACGCNNVRLNSSPAVVEGWNPLLLAAQAEAIRDLCGGPFGNTPGGGGRGWLAQAVLNILDGSIDDQLLAELPPASAAADARVTERLDAVPEKFRRWFEPEGKK
jgi:hypothetical protein